ncbi:MAG: amidohydrolase family protein [Chloroflexota bacterium]|nr:amidohydrolase family protein [Chloroflexota bacterium]MDE2908701.1 amidohydrolase family protein [Chloroflexota bacterium]
MIVDVHSHSPQFRGAVPEKNRREGPGWRPDRAVISVYNWDEYLREQAPADKTIVFGIAWYPGESTGGVNGPDEASDMPGNVNDKTAAFANAYPERLIGFMSLHPHDPHALDELERARGDLGLRGIKMGANYQNFHPLESRALAIYERAQTCGLPILFHQGTSPVRPAPIRYAHPLLMDEVAMRYPNLRIIMAHLGHPWTVDAAVVVRKHPYVYADISGLFYRPFGFYEAMIKATEWNVLDKLLFASDFPVTTATEAFENLRAVNEIVEGTNFPRVPEDKLEAIIYRDSLALLGLS